MSDMFQDPAGAQGITPGIMTGSIGIVDEQEPETPESRMALVKEISEKVKEGKKFHEKAYKRMREDMEVAIKGSSQQSFQTGKKYVANITQRHITQKVSNLYAKNPKAVADRRERRNFKVWDGNIQTLKMAYQDISTAAGGMDPNTGRPIPPRMPTPASMSILQDYQMGEAERRMVDAVGDTLVKLFHYQLDEQIPVFKIQMKKLVRRAVTTGVGFVKIGFQRQLQRRPEIAAQINDVTMKLAHIERLMEELSEGEYTPDDPQAEELRLMLQDLQAQPMLIVREGLVFDFPGSTSIIIDPSCKHLRGFIGANWIAHEILMTPEDVKETYGVELETGGYTSYDRKGQEQGTQRGRDIDARMKNDAYACVWEFYDKISGLVYSVCDGHKDFLEEPSAPNVTLERFFPFYALMFNDVENDNEIYPPSDVRLMVPMQDEYNRAREGLREHRVAARPKYLAPKGQIEETDKENLKRHEPHTVLEINIAPGQKATDLLMPVPVVGVDPNLYVTEHIMEDIQLVVGSQEATFGATSGATATESSIAQGSQMSSTQSNIDDLDDFLTEVARDSGAILLKEMTPDQVTEIVGPGAVWPQLNAEQIAKEIYLKIEAGSSGRPNKAADLANLERVLPYLIQIPGIDPLWLAKEVLKRLDDRLDVSEAVSNNIPAMLPPSITAMNSMSQPGTGDPTTSPEAQGGQGKFNNPGGKSQKGGSAAPMGANNMSGM